MKRFNWRRMKIVCLLLLGNLYPSTVRHWGLVGPKDAIRASVGWGPWVKSAK